MRISRSACKRKWLTTTNVVFLAVEVIRVEATRAEAIRVEAIRVAAIKVGIPLSRVSYCPLSWNVSACSFHF